MGHNRKLLFEAAQAAFRVVLGQYGITRIANNILTSEYGPESNPRFECTLDGDPENGEPAVSAQVRFESDESVANVYIRRLRLPGDVREQYPHITRRVSLTPSSISN